MIDSTSGRPQYRQLADQLRERIVSGELAAGQPIPSEERLRQDSGLSRTSVRQAVAILRAEGLVGVEQRPGEPRRTYVLRRDRRIVIYPGDVVTTTGAVVVTRADGKAENYPAGTVILPAL